MADLRTRLESTLSGAYAIERELGGGGMARVFLATERSLSRLVVIKVLSPELSAEVSAKRFTREVRLAASLQQANIVPVLSAGETDGMPHYVMPFVEGLSLREKLERDSRLSIGEGISLVRDVARALAYAHEHGVVHRDIKPENILLSGDAAVVTDFGVAKALVAARLPQSDPSLPGGQKGHSTVTHIGTAVGTPAYMSPEQISADPSVDHRADIYSLGCVAYEILTGAPPFAGASLQALFAAHLTQRPVPIEEKNTDLPERLSALVMRCLEKDPARRPQSAREILEELDGIPTIESSIARVVRRLPPRHRRAAAIAGTLALAGLAAFLLVRGTIATPAMASVAVVPFLNLDGDSTQEYLADGIADELATSLGKVDGVRVASRSLGYRYKGRRDLDATDVGRALSVDHVLHGSLRRAGGRLRVSAYLTSAEDNSEVWSAIYERSASDVFAIQGEITRGIANALGGEPRAQIGTADPDAYDLYLRGRFLMRRRGPGVKQAVAKLEESIARDSGFAQAHAALALALELLPYFEPVSAREVGPTAVAAAERALALDSTIADAHTALALAHQHRYQWSQAELSYRRALALDPQDSEAHMQYGRFLWYTGHVAESEPLFRRARELDPFSAQASSWYGHLLFLRGAQDSGLTEMRRAVEIDSSNPPSIVFLAGALRSMGDTVQSRALAQRLWRFVPTWRGVAIELQDSSLVHDVIRTNELRMDTDPHVNTRLAMIYGGLRDSTKFFEALERATARGEIWPSYYSLSDPRFDFVRKSARFAAIVRSVGLDERIFTSPTGGRVR